MADRRKDTEEDIVYYPFEEWVFDDDDDWINDPEIDAILEAYQRYKDEVILSDEGDELLLDPSNDAIIEAHKRSREEAFSSDDDEEEDEMDDDDYDDYDDYDDDEDDYYYDDDYYDDDEMEEEENTPETEMRGGGVGGTARPPLFEFQTRPLEPRRNWKNVLDKQRFQATLQQQRDPTPRENQAVELTEALRRAVQRQFDNNISLTPDSLVYFSMHADKVNHPFQSTRFKVSEYQDGSERLDTYLQTLAAQLNSNEEFTPDDTFTMQLIFVHAPGRGSGHKKRYKPCNAAVRKIIKKSVITINNKDQLCCVRAIVTMKARVDGGPNDRDYKNLLQGYPVQTRRAQELHRDARVPEGPCGIPELQKFQEALPDYQIKVMSVYKPYVVIYKGPPSLSKKIIRLLKEDGHYNGCNSYKGFLDKSYFCDECDRGFDHDDIHHHSCKGKRCPSCKRDNCNDYKRLKQPLEPGRFPSPTEPCRLCHRKFFGDECYNHHLYRRSNNTLRSVCDTYKKCLDCCHVYERDPQVRHGGNRHIPDHRCGWGECQICEKKVFLATRKCYIQRLKEDEDNPKRKKILINNAGTRPYDIDEEDPNYCWVERDPPLQVYCDYEAVTDAEGYQTPILVCLESDEADDPETFHGLDCTVQLFDHLDEIAKDEDDDDRNVIVIFHNFKGYDGMFILQYCYDHGMEVEGQITVGTKILSFRSDRFISKDSLCFLPFPLANFPATFRLTELRKGFFPHKFNTLENQDYEGPIAAT